MNKYIEEFREACIKLEAEEDHLYSNNDIAVLKKRK